MSKKLSSLAGWKIGVGILCLLMIAFHAKGDKVDDYNAKFTRDHPDFHGFLTPHPPYPLQAGMFHEQGSVQVRVSFAAKGKVEDVVIVKSSGSAVLDSNTTNYIKRYWLNLSGKPASHTLTLDYHLR